MKPTNWLRRSSPTILCCIATAGVIGTAITAARATPKALEKLKKAKNEKGDLTKAETILVIAPNYIPTAVIGIGTVVCIFGANVLTRKNQAALISAYTLAEQSFKEYKDKLRELYGDEVCQNVEQAIIKEHCRDIYISAGGLLGDSTLITETDVLEMKRTFYDSFSNRCFESTLPRVMNAEYHLNRNYSLGASVMVNDFYEFLGLDPISGGNVLGWDMAGGLSWIDFDHHTETLDDGMEVIVIDMVYEPYPYTMD